MAVKNKVQLITYPDSLGGDLKVLNNVLDKYFPNTFKGGIHILPPFPSSGDRGFAPLTYFDIEPSFGTWEDIRKIGEKHDILLDLMVNHISKNSVFFKDFLKEGKNSKYADLFLTLDKIWSDGNPVQEDINKMFLRRKVPYSTFNIEKTNEKISVWTTFGKETPSEQIDLDINSKVVRNLLRDFFINFHNNNVKIVRLDAVGYVIKKLGTSCFFVEPEIYEFLDWVTDLANSLDIDLLPEVHANYSTQFKLAKHGNWIYDFILPYMILSTIINKNSSQINEYLMVRPHNQFTMLDCHDGIPVKPDLDNLISTKEAREIVDHCLKHGANLSFVHSDAHKSQDGFDVHQIRCSYYSVLNCNDDAYLTARAIQFFAPGIPQVYYVGLLAGKNDEANVKLTGEGREINRHNFSLEEIDSAYNQEVVQRLLKLIDFRNNYPAFNGEFIVEPSKTTEIILTWKNNTKYCTLKVDLTTSKSIIEYLNENNEKAIYKI